VLVLADFLHHKPVDLVVANRRRVHLLKFVENPEQLPFELNERVGGGLRSLALHLTFY